MIKRDIHLMRLLFVSVFITSLLNEPARAADDDKPIRLYATAAFGPVGKVLSLGAISINGRRVYGEQMIWGGELLQVSDDARARVFLDSIGQLTLSSEASLKVATALAILEDGFGCSALVAKLSQGDMAVKLQPGAVAYIEACDSEFTATNSASFHIRIRGNEAALEVTSGTVNVESYKGRRARPQSVTVDPNTKQPTGPRSDTYEAPQNGNASIRVKFVDAVTSQPVVGVLVRFFLFRGIASFNSQEVTVQTDNFGVATANLTGGPDRGETRVTATILGDEWEGKWEGKVIVGKPPGFFRARNIALLSAAAVVTVLIIKPPTHGKKPISTGETNIP